MTTEEKSQFSVTSTTSVGTSTTYVLSVVPVVVPVVISVEVPVVLCVGVSLQAVDHGASLPAVVLLLPFVHLVNQFEEGALGDRCVPVHRPAQELELLHHAVPVLWLGGNSEDGGGQINSL